jgi:hypothetical protein
MNNANDASKRTAAQVAKILKAYGINAKPENMGDGRTFSISCTDLKTRIALKKAGFILNRSLTADTFLIFKTH